MKKLLKTTIFIGSVLFAHELGKHIEGFIQRDNSIDEIDKPVYTFVSCSVAGTLIGLIARYITKRI